MQLTANLRNTALYLAWVILLIMWIATSSVLRAPPIVLLMKHAAKSQVPQLAALVLVR